MKHEFLLCLAMSACTVEPLSEAALDVDDAKLTALAGSDSWASDTGDSASDSADTSENETWETETADSPPKLDACPFPVLPRTATYEADGVTYTVYLNADSDRCGEHGILVTWIGSDESYDQGCMRYDGVEELGDVRVRAYRGWAMGVVWYMCGSLLVIAPDYSDPEVAEDPDEHWDPIYVPTKIID